MIVYNFVVVRKRSERSRHAFKHGKQSPRVRRLQQTSAHAGVWAGGWNESVCACSKSKLLYQRRVYLLEIVYIMCCVCLLCVVPLQRALSLCAAFCVPHTLHAKYML